MPDSLSDYDRRLLERAVLAPKELSGTENAEVRGLLDGSVPAQRYMEELEAFYGSVEASYEERPAPSPAVRRLARSLLSGRLPPRVVRLRRYEGGERPASYVLHASAVPPSRFVQVAALVGDEVDLVVRFVQDVVAGECIVYVVTSPERRAFALLESEVLPAPIVTDPRGRVAFACPQGLDLAALDRRAAVHPSLCEERITTAAFEDGAAKRIEAADGGGEAALLTHRDGVLHVAPAEGHEAFRWLVVQVDGEAPLPVALRNGRGATAWAGRPVTLRGYA